MPALIADRARPAALVTIAVGAVVTVALAVVVWRGTTTSFDSWVIVHSLRDLGPLDGSRRRAWLFFSEPVISLLVPVVVVVWAWRTRQARLAVFGVVAPLLAIGVTELIGKPLVGRWIGPNVLAGSTLGAQRGSYPSGHETGTVSWLLLVLLVVFARTRDRRVRAAASVAAGLWALAGAFGLTVNYYHYATDTIGAICCTAAVVLGMALLLDRYGDAWGAAVRRRVRRDERVG